MPTFRSTRKGKKCFLWWAYVCLTTFLARISYFKFLEFKELNKRIIPFALVGFETGYSQLSATRLVAYLPGTLRFDNGDGNGNLRSLGRGSLCDVGVPAKIEITILWARTRTPWRTLPLFYMSARGFKTMPKFRDTILLAHASRLINTDEFVLLYDVNKPKNPDLSYTMTTSISSRWRMMDGP